MANFLKIRTPENKVICLNADKYLCMEFNAENGVLIFLKPGSFDPEKNPPLVIPVHKDEIDGWSWLFSKNGSDDLWF